MRSREPLLQTWPEPVFITAIGAAAEGDLALPDRVAPLFSPNGRSESRLPALTARAPGARVVLRALERLTEQPGLGELPPPPRRAIVVGSQVAALNETIEFLSEVATAGPALVNPGLFPLTVMNAAAGLAAIQHECAGANLTLNNGATSVLDAIAYAADLASSGSADVVFAGGFESFGDRAGGALGRPPGTLAAAVLVALSTASGAERMGAAPLARLAAYSSGTRQARPGPETRTPTLAAALEVLESAGDPVGSTELRIDASEAVLFDLAEALARLRSGDGGGGTALRAASGYGDTEAALILAPVEPGS